MGGCCTSKSHLKFDDAITKEDIKNLINLEKDKLNNDLKSFSFENKEYFYINQCILNLEEFLIILMYIDEEKIDKLKKLLKEFLISFYDEDFDQMNEVKRNIENKI